MNPPSSPTHFWLPMLTLWKREVVRFLRQKNRVIGALATPVMFWALIGSGMGTAFRPPSLPAGQNYLQYFYPGTMLMIVLFTAIFSTISIIEDRREGFLQGVLVAPVSPFSIVLGKILGGSTLAVGQSLIFYLLAPLVGLHFTPGGLFYVLVTLALLSLALTALGYVIAWPMQSVQGFHAIMNLFLLPLWLLSGALFASETAVGWVRWIMAANPLTYGLLALRQAFDPGSAPCLACGSAWITGNLVMLATGLALVCLAASMTQRTFRA